MGRLIREMTPAGLGLWVLSLLPIWLPDLRPLMAEPILAELTSLAGIRSTRIIDGTNRVLLSLYALAFLWAFVRMARAHGRSPLLVVFAAPLVFHGIFALGAVAYSIGLVLVVGALALSGQALRGAEGGERSMLALAASLSAVGAAALGSVAWLAAVPALIVDAAWAVVRGGRRRTAGMIVLGTVLLPALVGVVRYYGWNDAASDGGHGQLEVSWLPLGERLANLPHRILALHGDDRAALALVALFVLWFALLGARDEDERPRSLAPEVLFFSTAILCVALPSSLGGRVTMPLVAERLVPLVAVAAVLLVRAQLALARRQRAIVWVAAAVAAAHLVDLGWSWRRIDRRNSAFAALAVQIPPGARSLVVNLDAARIPAGNGRAPAFDAAAEPLLSLRRYAAFLSSGRSVSPWSDRAGFDEIGRHVEAGVGTISPDEIQRLAHAGAFEFLLVRGEETERSLFGADDVIQTQVIAKRDRYTLYRWGR